MNTGTKIRTIAFAIACVNQAIASVGAVGAVAGANTGSSGNLQPYVVVKRWHRIG